MLWIILSVIKHPNETLPWAWLLTVAGVRLNVRDLHAVGWGEGP